jgi:hypothetical protein
MRVLYTLVLAHPFWSGVVGYWVFSAAVSSLPAPNGSGNGYKWLYTFLNKLAGNIFTAFGDKIPGVVPPASNASSNVLGPQK